ncbi:putative sulfate exporter family transporter [Gardnerella swidsinskii]|uniref:Sulfate exporter family transporter n=1 Tax=Gardnerella swidsinskii TaxID=2792979 RepID=A0A9X7I939_9BIFI|nr:putative sulfate exporter family transporter [Gardnerella swidsinskii]NSX40835.1 putative sulfate exporter family transporter [Gardnerella vaginalis]PMC54862.1 putative sulfate exporter family transporter [Gardnerella swidsinskii]
MVNFFDTWKKKICTIDMALIAVLTLLASFISSWLKQYPGFQLLGALIIALLVGMALQLPLHVYKMNNDSRRAGVKSAAGLIANKLLRLGIILLGFKLNLHDLFTKGIKCLPIAAVLVAIMVCVTYNIAKLLKVNPQLAMLTAGGTSICGAAAVMGLSGSMPVLPEEEDEKEQNEVMAVATVAIMGTIYALAEIFILPNFGMTKQQLGITAGASLHEIAHAVAAGGAFNSIDVATIMKLSRVLMLVPASIFIAIWWNARHSKVENGGKHKISFPWFMLGFIAASVIGTYVPFVAAHASTLVEAGYVFLGMAMAALGINVNFRAIFKQGRAAFAASFLASIVLVALAYAAAVLFF